MEFLVVSACSDDFTDSADDASKIGDLNHAVSM